MAEQRPFTFIPDWRHLGRLSGWLEEYRTVVDKPTQMTSTGFLLKVSGPVVYCRAPFWRRLIYHALWITTWSHHG